MLGVESLRIQEILLYNPTRLLRRGGTDNQGPHAFESETPQSGVLHGPDVMEEASFFDEEIVLNEGFERVCCTLY